MRIRLLSYTAALTLMAGFGLAQDKGDKAAAQPQKKGVPKKEYDAFTAIGNEPDLDQRIKKVDEFIAKFSDTSLKSLALDEAAEAEEQKRDSVKAIAYSETALEADPKDFPAMLLISGELARGTRENDLDKAEKLARAEKLANDAIATVKVATKPNPKASDEQWTAYQKDEIAQGHVDLGMVALARKKVDVAIAEFKEAVDGAATQDPVPMVRLAAAYDQGGKYDESVDILNKVLAMPNLNPTVKQFAENEKKRAEQAKATKK